MMYFFDLDGTLIDSNGIWQQVDHDFLAKRGMSYSREYYEGVAHVPLPMAAEFTKAFCKLEESCEDIIAEWMDMSRNMYANIPLKPGVREYLDQCLARGIPMALVTSSMPEHCHTALERLDLNRYFQNVTFAQQAGMHKRLPDVWLLAAEKNGVRPEDCTVFDDSAEACKGAKSAGMRTVGVFDRYFNVHTEEMMEVCDQYIRSFEELL